jgi:hypothetical protein
VVSCASSAETVDWYALFGLQHNFWKTVVICKHFKSVLHSVHSKEKDVVLDLDVTACDPQLTNCKCNQFHFSFAFRCICLQILLLNFCADATI